MANSPVELHSPTSDHNDLSRSTHCDPDSTSDTDSMEETVEFRLIMAYAQRRRPTKDCLFTLKGGTDTKGPPSPRTPANTEKEEKEEKKRKKGLTKYLQSLLRCIRPQTVDEELPPAIATPPDVGDRCGVRADSDAVSNGVEETNEEDRLGEVVGRLTEIADDIPFSPPDLEVDSPENDVEKVIGLLLRDAGDRLNEKELKDAILAKDIFWNYSFFRTLISTLLTRMGLMSPDPYALGPQASPKTLIAVTCEVTSRLSAVDTLPMNRMLDHGARYLHDHYSAWAQKQGGYEEAFHSDDEDD